MLTTLNGMSLISSNFSVVLSYRQPSRVIISVPHDTLVAGDFYQVFKPRQTGVTVRDLYVWPIANEVVHLSHGLGVSVDAIRFLMSRVYVDVNRALTKELNLDPDAQDQTALDDQSLVPVYEHYHNELAKLVERSIDKFGSENILLIDLHGFGKELGYDLILGTANRSTIPHGNPDINLAEFVENKGYSVFLPGIKPISPEGDPFDAGQTTRWYAKHYGINVIQVEIFSSFRKKGSEEKGKRLAVDLSEFLSTSYG